MEQAPDLEQQEVTPLALELAGSYRTMVAFYSDQMEVTDIDADARARGNDDTPDEARSDLERIRGDRPTNSPGST
jgi:hypothetical protein